jgi:poly(hydroxyalkanoate) granule-associated protein
MVKKLQKSSDSTPTTETKVGAGSPLASTVKDSAQQIWLAGLGAFAKAQQEGGKVFEALVQEGLSVQRKTQAVAEERIADATNRMTGMANDITSKATGQWDKLETIFEERVSRTLNKLGVPTAQDIELLIARIDELNRNVQMLQPKSASSTKAKAEAAVEPVAVATKKPASRKKVVAEVVDVVEKPAAAARKSAKATAETVAADANTAAAA